MVETLAPPMLLELTETDQLWLASFGVDPAWQNDEAVSNKLNNVIALGSRRLDEPVNQGNWHAIIGAREEFMKFVGVAPAALATFREKHPTIAPLDTFIQTQRTMGELGLNAVKIINTYPGAIGYSSESLREKVVNLTELGLDAARVINASPKAITLAPESVREKVVNLTELGLDAVKIINTLTTALTYAPESVRNKVRFLERSIRLLRWDYSAQELINTYPTVLSFNTQKLAILRRIAALNVSEQSRSTEPRAVANALSVPLEKYILELVKTEENNDTIPANPHLTTLARAARNSTLNAAERSEGALQAATTSQTLGRLGAMYLTYRNQ